MICLRFSKRFLSVNILFFIFIFLMINSVKAETVYELDFTKASGDVITWFEENKWEPRKDIAEMNLRFEDGKLESSSFKRIAISIKKNFTSEITIPIDLKGISMYHFLRKCDGEKEDGPIQVNFEPGPNKALS